MKKGKNKVENKGNSRKEHERSRREGRKVKEEAEGGEGKDNYEKVKEE